MLTAIGNDFGYDDVFVRQLEGLGRSGDVLLAVSTSGNSRNVLRAAEKARALKITVIGLTGSGHCSGALKDPARYNLGRYAAFLKGYVEELASRGIKPEVLSGSHGEQAVMVIPEAEHGKPVLTMPGTGKGGKQAFIFHQDDFFGALEALGEEIAQASGVSASELTRAIREAGEAQLTATLERLADGLPMYHVVRAADGALTAELVVQDMVVA